MDFRSTFLADTKALFLEGRKEHMGPYLYSTPDPNIEGDMAKGEVCYFELVYNNPDYYLYREEGELIQSVASKMASYIPSESSVIEFGPGTDIAFKNKTLPFLKEIDNLKTYIPVDLCQTYLDDSEKIVREAFSGKVEVEKINTNFIKNVDLVANFDRASVLFKGSTIANLTASECLEFLQRLNQSLETEGVLVIGTDSNQNKETLQKAYSEKMAKLTETIPHFINRELPIEGFDPYAFEYKFYWDKDNYCVQHNVLATKEQDFILDEIPVHIDRGTKFHLLSSYKYPVEYFQDIARQAGFKPLDYFVHDNQRMTVHILAA